MSVFVGRESRRRAAWWEDSEGVWIGDAMGEIVDDVRIGEE